MLNNPKSEHLQENMSLYSELVVHWRKSKLFRVNGETEVKQRAEQRELVVKWKLNVHKNLRPLDIWLVLHLKCNFLTANW